MTQEVLAQKINKERPLISHIERTGKVNHYTLQKICKVLRITPADLENVTNDPEQYYVKDTSDQMRQLKLENEQLKKDLRQKEELIQTQKEYIEVLKKTSGRQKRK